LFHGNDDLHDVRGRGLPAPAGKIWCFARRK
jgi:hypothetical protein